MSYCWMLLHAFLGAGACTVACLMAGLDAVYYVCLTQERQRGCKEHKILPSRLLALICRRGTDYCCLTARIREALLARNAA